MEFSPKIAKDEERLDPSLYSYEHIQSILDIEKMVFKKIEDIDYQCIRGKTPSEREYQKEGEVAVIKVGNVNANGIINLESGVSYIPDDLWIEKYSHVSVEKDDLIFVATGKGSIGKVGIVQEDFKAISSGENIILRKKDNSKIDPYYLLAFFLSDYGKIQLEYRTIGPSGQTHLYPNSIYKMEVPLVNNSEEIISKLKKAVKNSIEAKNNKNAIDDIFKKDLPIDYTLPNDVSFDFDANAARCINKRLDPHFYHPKYHCINRLIENISVKLGEIADFSTLTCNPSDFDKKTFTYVEIDNINIDYGFIEDHSEKESAHPPSRARKILNSGNLLISLTRPYRGAIAIVDDAYDKSIATTGFSVSLIEDPEFDVYYVCAFLKTKLGIMQLEQRMSNANYPAIVENYLNELLVPKIPEEDRKLVSCNMSSIISLLRESKSLRTEAVSELKDKVGRGED
jgi:restriction endonuclease S subunit